MTETACVSSGTADFGQALGALFRAYLTGARAVLDQLPGATRGYQVLSIAATAACSNQAAIAQVLGIDRTVMTHLIDDLESAGLVERRPDPADRRARQILLTAKGRRSLQNAATAIRRVEEDVLRALTPEEMSQFKALLAKVVPESPQDEMEACAEIAGTA